MSYDPQVNDYVIWDGEYHKEEGWIYWKDEVDETYLTIEIGVKPKPYCNVVRNMLHCNDHILVVCYKENWCDLKYVKSRKSVHDET